MCVCGEVKPVPRCHHAVTVVLPPAEAARGSSTHKLITMAIRGSDTAVFGTGETPDWETLCGRLGKLCEASGRTPVLLYPNATAVPAAAWYATALTAAQRAAGVHIVVLDGTWHDTQRMARLRSRCAVAAALPSVVLSPPSRASLFQPLRKQHEPSHICTTEAVALMLDELHAVDARIGIAAAATAAAAAAVPAPAPARMPSSLAGRHLRYAMAAFVDRSARLLGRVGPEAHLCKGAGYGTWRLGEGAGLLSRVKVSTLVVIAEFAYGRPAVRPCGYPARVNVMSWLGVRPERVVVGDDGWAVTLMPAPPGGASGELHAACPPAAGGLRLEGPAGGAGAAADAGTRPPAAGVDGEVQPSEPGSSPVASVKRWRVRRRDRVGKLPLPSPYTANALALTNSEVFFMLAGFWKVDGLNQEPDGGGHAAAAPHAFDDE
jgi:DTW domain-containing protein YfiP